MSTARSSLPAVLAALVLVSCLSACVSALPKPVLNPPRIDGFRPLTSPGEVVTAVALGGGAARGFAHVGVLTALDDFGIDIDIVTGTSAGSVVGALYAGGLRGAGLIEAARALHRDELTDFTSSGLGVIAGEKLQDYVNELLGARPIERLDRRFAAVATDLQNGTEVTFTGGNTGMAVRASSSIPGIFRPVEINGRLYVDGGLISQIPVAAARDLGADLVIAVDVSRPPAGSGEISSVLDVINQAFLIMSKTVVDTNIADADIVLRPKLGDLSMVDFDKKDLAIDEGRRVVKENLGRIRQLYRDKARKKRLN